MTGDDGLDLQLLGVELAIEHQVLDATIELDMIAAAVASGRAVMMPSADGWSSDPTEYVAGLLEMVDIRRAAPPIPWWGASGATG